MVECRVACQPAADAIIGAMAISLRRATASHAGAAADLWLRARKAAVGTIPPSVHDDEDVRAWFASHVVQDTELWLAEDTESRLFAGILVLDGRWLDQLYVEPTMTGRGIGASWWSWPSARVRTGYGSGRSRPMWERSASTSDTVSSRSAAPMAATTRRAHRTFSTFGASLIADRRRRIRPTVLARRRPGRGAGVPSICRSRQNDDLPGYCESRQAALRLSAGWITGGSRRAV